jgi:hypothetical protein
MTEVIGATLKKNGTGRIATHLTETMDYACGIVANDASVYNSLCREQLAPVSTKLGKTVAKHHYLSAVGNRLGSITLHHVVVMRERTIAYGLSHDRNCK